MNKSLLAYANRQIVEWMEREHPDFVRLKLRAVTRNAFCKKVDARRCAWISIGAEGQSTLLHAQIYWTREGDTLKELDALADFDTGAGSAKGWLQLTDAELGDDDDSCGTLCFDDPPKDIQQAALAEHKRTDMYKRSYDLLEKQMRRKNSAVTEAEIALEDERCLRAWFTSWDSIDEAIQLTERQLAQASANLLHNIFTSLDRHAIPYLESRLT